MRKILLCNLILLMMIISILGCGKQESNSTQPKLPEIPKEQLESYKDIGEKATKDLKDTTPEEKAQIKQEAIYNEVAKRETQKFEETVQVTQKELDTYLNNKNNKKPVLVVTALDHDYFVYNKEDVKDNTYLGMQVSKSREATEDDIKKDAVEHIKSGKLTELLKTRTSQVNNIQVKGEN